MTSPPRLSRSKQFRLIIPGVFGVLGILTLAGFAVWQTWQSFEAYYLAKNKSGIDAEVVSASSYRMSLSGSVKFKLYNHNIYRDCVAKADFGGSSNHLKFKPGAIIKIIPRTGCDNPIVIAAIGIPIFSIFMSIFYASFGFVLVKKILQAFH